MTITSTYDACAIIEGFDGEAHSEEDVTEAVQYLIDNGDAWRLQGFYGRLAMDFINTGRCTKYPRPTDTSTD